jgi:hypothetical protein
MRPTRREASGSRSTVDSDGVVRIDGPRSRARRLVAGGAALAIAAAVAWLFITVRSERRESAPSVRSSASPPASGKAGSFHAAPALAGSPPASGAVDEDEPAEVYLDQIDPAAVSAGGEPPTGIHLFPRPGTKPIKGGILVPEGYALPPGYMRHYQATDDGEPVQAILVFHPDYQPVDAAGRPIPLPADRVVPPELAPPGMAVEMLEPPPVRRDLDETGAPPAAR